MPASLDDPVVDLCAGTVLPRVRGIAHGGAPLPSVPCHVALKLFYAPYGATAFRLGLGGPMASVAIGAVAPLDLPGRGSVRSRAVTFGYRCPPGTAMRCQTPSNRWGAVPVVKHERTGGQQTSVRWSFPLPLPLLRRADPFASPSVSLSCLQYYSRWGRKSRVFCWLGPFFFRVAWPGVLWPRNWPKTGVHQAKHPQNPLAKAHGSPYNEPRPTT